MAPGEHSAEIEAESKVELRAVLRQGRVIWSLIPFGLKLGLGGGAILMALGSACSTAIPVLIGLLVDGVQRDAAHLRHATFFEIAGQYLSLIAGALLLREVMNVGRRYLIENTCARTERSLTTELVRHLLQVDLATLSRYRVGALDNRISRSVEGVIRFLRLAFIDFLPALLTGAFAISAAVWKKPILGLVMAAVIPISLLLTRRQLVSQKGVRLRLMRLGEEMDGTIVEQLGGVEYIRAAHTEGMEGRRLDRVAMERCNLAVRHHFVMSLFGCSKALNEGLSHVVVLAFAAYYASRGAISIGDILSLSLLFMGVMAPLNEIHRVIDEGHESSLRTRDFLRMLEEPVDSSYQVSAPVRPRLVAGRPAIVLRNVRVDHASFRGEAVRALDDVSFEVKYGETVGIVGRSGSGKSTCARVLLNLVHPNEGEVLIGGVPLEGISREVLAHLFGYVSQRPFVFAGTVEENIAYGPSKASASEEDIRRVAAIANIHDEIAQMPRGYQAQLAEHGRNLSGGQCQRLALARTLLHEPPILIFDEATSALDNISERNVQQELDLKRADRTILLIAHRLSTLRNTDRILVFDGGHIVETGSFRDLLKAGGLFSELARSAHE
jgi:ATP-binding cassette subfamily B protein